MIKIKKFFKLKKVILVSFLLPFFSLATFVSNEEFLKDYVNTIIPDESVDTYKYINLKFSWYKKGSSFEKTLKKWVYYNLLTNEKKNISPNWLITTKKASDYIYQWFWKNIILTWNFLTSEQKDYIFENIYAKNSYEDSYYINNIKNFIETNFYTGYDTIKLKQASANAMVESLWDEYSQYFSPSQAESFNNQLSWSYQWIWVVLDFLSWDILVSKIFSWSAQKAWIQVWDKIVSLNWNKLTSLEDFFNFWSWKNFKITLQRNWKLLNFELKKQTISIPLIEYIFSGWVNYIKINEFSTTISQDFEKIIPQFSWNKFIFDLRDNPGGDVDETLNILDHFVAEWKEVLTFSSRNWKTTLKSIWPWNLTGKFVVLINKNSASASEIFALNMKNLGAKLVWEKSFWKWTSQAYQNFDDWSAIKITSALWSLGWESINKIGVSPHFELKDENQQLQKAYEILK